MENQKYESEINFKNLLKNPIRLFGWIFPLILVILLASGVYYVKQLNNIHKNELSPLITDSTFIKIENDLVQKKGGIVPAVDLALITKPTPEFINKGKELFLANCKSCHGDNGKGDGPSSAAMNPKPRNFHVIDGWTNGRTFSDLYKTLQEGIIKNGMAAYEYIPAGDRIAIISYIRTFVKFPDISTEEVATVDKTYKLSEGTKVPNQIPVKQAINYIINENLPSFQTITNKLKNDKSLNQLLTNRVVNIEYLYKITQMPDSNWTKYVFMETIENNPKGFGLKNNISYLNDNEWNQFFEIISKYRGNNI